jgi:arylsulfatase A-like enzyme
MSTPTPNVDLIARDGVLLTDCYAPASCTRRLRGVYPHGCGGA